MTKNNFFKGKKVFVSGGAGVIGSALVRLLHMRGAIILVGDLKPRPPDWPRAIHYREGDLNYLTQSEVDAFKPEIFFHLAASFERSEETYEFWDEEWQNNPHLSHHLVTLLKDSQTLKSIIFASSYLIYDKFLYSQSTAPNGAHALSEDAHIMPRNLTGAAKLLHEIELGFIAHFRNDVQVVCARIYRSYGKDSRDVISRWIRALLSGDSIIVYHPENRFDYVYAEDVAEGLIRLSQSGWSGSVNLATGRSRAVADVVATLRTHFPSMKYSKKHTHEVFEASEADVTLLHDVVNWQPRTSLEEGIQRIITFERARSLRAPLPEIRVLITSVSHKVPLVADVRRALEKCGGSYRLYGGDISPDATARYFVDHFWRMPKTKAKYFKKILAFLKREKINRVIPTRDGELLFWSAHAPLLLKNGISVMVSGLRAVTLTLDKLKFAQWGTRENFSIIPTSNDINDIRTTRFVVKERFGAGSRTVSVNLSRAEALLHAQKLSDPIFQPYINGEEYSVDLYLDTKGVVKGTIVRKRILVVDGESQITKVVHFPTIATVCGKMAVHLKLRGHVLFQVIRDRRGRFHIIECNARFGGASRASVAAGLDSFYWFLLESRGADLSVYPFVPKVDLTMVRFKEDMFLP